MLLMISGLISVILKEYIDGSLFITIALLNAMIGFFQEYHAKQNVQSLEKLIEHNVRVRREGELCTIPNDKIVEGDIVLCTAGDVLVADVLVREAEGLLIDTSIRTGRNPTCGG